MKNKIIIGIMLFITLIVIEIWCIYAVEGENIWNFFKEYWNWYKTLF